MKNNIKLEMFGKQMTRRHIRKRISFTSSLAFLSIVTSEIIYADRQLKTIYLLWTLQPEYKT